MNKAIARLAVLALSLLVSLVVAEISVRVVSRNGLRILDAEMWRYAKLIKKDSDLPAWWRSSGRTPMPS